jgi:hypothetical protein
MFQCNLEKDWSDRCLTCKSGKDLTIFGSTFVTQCNNPKSEKYNQKIENPNTSTREYWRYKF